MTWELTWPLAAIDLAMVLFIHGLVDARDETLDSIWAIAGFFVVSPFVIRRAFLRTYGGRKIDVLRRQGSNWTSGGALQYQESLKVMWLLAWRTLVLALGGVLVFSLILRVTGLNAQSFSVQSRLANAVGISLVDSVASLVFTPVLIPGMLRKRYRGFRLEVADVPQPAPVQSTPAKSRKK